MYLFCFADRDFCLSDVRTVCQKIDDKISGITCAETPELRHGQCPFLRNLSYGRKSIRHRTKDGYFLTVCPLDDHFVIARAVKPQSRFIEDREVTIIPFVIIDNTTGQVLQDLSHWVVSPQASWAFHNVKFEAICSCSGRYTIIIGPDENNCSMKTTKLLTRKKPFTLRLKVSMIYFIGYVLTIYSVHKVLYDFLAYATQLWSRTTAKVV